MKARSHFRRFAALLLAAALLLSSCGGGAKATSMHLRKTEGKVSVSDGGGKDVEPREDLGLYSGYGLRTRDESYAWIDLDEAKLTKMDQETKAEIQKDGKDLEIIIKEGALFFNVTQPLADDETMTIRTSSMLVGIRGTCGWVEVPDDGTMKVFLLEGKVRCEADGEKETVRAGEMAVMTEDGEITVSEFTANDVPAFVMEEIEDDDDLMGAVPEGGSDTPAPSDPAADAMAAYQPILGQAASYFSDLTDYSEMDAAITYRYALVPMQAGSPIPALILEEEADSAFWGYFGTAIAFQYDPNSQSVVQAEGTMGEGVAGAGGYRGMLTAAGDGNGILETSWSSGTGQGSTYRITISGSALNRTSIWSGRIDGDSTGGVGSAAIDWHDISDLSGLNGGMAASPQPQPQPAEPEPSQGSHTALFSPYAGDYTPYPESSDAYAGGERWRNVTLDENGVITGGGTSWYSLSSSGAVPSSIDLEADGSIKISFSENEYYTVYPAGAAPEGYSYLDNSVINLRYFLFDGGVMEIWYHK